MGWETLKTPIVWVVDPESINWFEDIEIFLELEKNENIEEDAMTIIQQIPESLATKSSGSKFEGTKHTPIDLKRPLSSELKCKTKTGSDRRPTSTITTLTSSHVAEKYNDLLPKEICY